MHRNHQTKADIYDLYGDFLSGRKREITRRFPVPHTKTIVERLKYLKEICAGKNVLHVGCLDHPELIMRKVQNGTWLHGIVSEAAKLCIGVDVNIIGYNFIRDNLHLHNVELLDFTRSLSDDDLRPLRRVHWDVILCPEVFEHITNHQQFLSNFYRIADHATLLVVTGPNAFSLANFVNTLRGFEELNSDHNYWFTFYTLSHMLNANGWNPHSLRYYSIAKKKCWLRILSNVATQFSPAFAEGIIIEARKQ